MMPAPTPLPFAPKSPARIGVVGTGFISAGLCLLLATCPDLQVTRVLTRRPDGQRCAVPHALLTRSVADLLDHSDLIVECTGDVRHASSVIDAALQADLPVVTMNSEFHATVGSWFCTRGRITEAEGDQPGSLAAMNEEVLQMGFRPLVYGNIKGFLNHHPSESDMAWWAEHNGISQSKVTAFTDGTKLQFEQTLVANGLGASIVQRGMLGLRDVPLDNASLMLAQEAVALGGAVTDYVLNPSLPAGVFIVAEHLTARPEVLRYLKLGDGPYYTLLRPYHLCHLEMPRTIRRMLAGQRPLLNNSVRPHTHVVAVAKRDMKPGHVIPTAIGGNDLRGEAVSMAELPDGAPLGLLDGAQLRHSISQGQTLKLSDVDIPESTARSAWEQIMRTHREQSSRAV
jgi:predicted homoserine dehydrogenase-like protein